MKGIIVAVIMLISYAAVSAADWDEAYIDSLYRGRQLAVIEGIWQFPAGGATVAILKERSSTYTLYLLDSPRLDVKPGTIIGTAIDTPKKGYYDCELKSSNLGLKHKLSSQTVTLTVDDAGTLSIKPYKTGYSVSFRRWLYYFSKLSIIDNTNKRPTDLDGAKRIYPYKLSDHYPICL